MRTNASGIKIIEENDVLTANFGVTMSMPVFFKVVKRTPACAFVKELESKEIEGDHFIGKCIPRDEFTLNAINHKPIRCMIKCDDHEQYIVIDRQICTLWTGKPEYYNYLD